MGDALKHSIQLDKEDKAKEEYVEALIDFLVLPTEENKTVALEKMSSYNIIHKGNILSELKKELETLVLGDQNCWRIFNSWAETQLFYRRFDLREKFLQEAQKRNIGSYKWTL